jgi:hypothetical protein
MPPKKQMVPKSKAKANVLNLNDKSENFRFVESQHVFSGNWVVLGGKNESSIQSIVLNSMQFFLNLSLLGYKRSTVMGFIVTFSCMCIEYFNYIHHHYYSLLFLISPSFFSFIFPASPPSISISFLKSRFHI